MKKDRVSFRHSQGGEGGKNWKTR